MDCPCCSGKIFEECCEPFLLNNKKPAIPEELMRSRYSAYTQINIPYLIETTHPKTRKYYSPKAMQEWAETCNWLKLEVIEAHDNKVLFHAHFEDENGITQVHKELSTFKQEDGVWYFVDGEEPSRLR